MLLDHSDDKLSPPSFRTWAFIGFTLIAGFFLLTEHRTHVFGVLPYLLLLACPLMHIFGHGHGSHGGHGDTGANPQSPDASTTVSPAEKRTQ